MPSPILSSSSFSSSSFIRDIGSGSVMATTVNLELKVSTDSVGLTKIKNPLGDITLVATDVHPRVKCPITGMILEGASHGRHVGVKLEPKRQAFVRSRKLFITSEHDLIIQTLRSHNKMSANTNEKRVPTGLQVKNPLLPAEPPKEEEYYA